MNSPLTGRIALAGAFALGLATIGWIAAGFVGTHPIALVMSLLIALVYLGGAVETTRFRAATATLSEALGSTTQAPEVLEDWLLRIDASLRPAVRLRIEGERAALPGLALTPYLVGLLVMLGMLGTFMGMVATFHGTVLALEGSTDLDALRAALAGPVKGLGLAFGTSVAGVAGSAMLGLMSVLVRRDRTIAARALDARIPGFFRAFSLPHQRQATWQALQAQGSNLPQLGAQLAALIESIEHRQAQLDDTLLQRQQQTLKDVGETCATLLGRVESALERNLDAAVQRGNDALQASAATASGAMQDALAASAHSVGTTVGAAMESLTAESRAAQAALAETVHARFSALLEGVVAHVERAASAAARSDQQRLATSIEAVQSVAGALRAEIERTGALTQTQHAATARLLEDAAARVATDTAQSATRAQEDISRLLAQSEELVRARIESEARWQQQFAERDAATLQERAQLLGNIEALLQRVAQATGEQRAAIETLVGSASAVLDRVGGQFADTLAVQTERAESAATRVAGSAIDLASLGEAFRHGVQVFGATHGKLVESLGQVEAALGRHMARSDEQLAYYVAQAREVVDLSISAQQGILEDLRRLHAAPQVFAVANAPAAEEVEG